MNDQDLKYKYFSLLQVIGYSRRPSWQAELKRRYKLKELHTELNSRGILV